MLIIIMLFVLYIIILIRSCFVLVESLTCWCVCMCIDRDVVVILSIPEARVCTRAYCLADLHTAD